MFKLKYLLPIFMLSFLVFTSCEEEEDPEEEEQQVEINSTSIIPSSTSGRPNNYLGCIEVSSRITTIQVWDHGQIDGDIVSIIANGNTIINEQVLDGPSNPISVDYDFGFNGFNYVTLFAHNLGSISPNTCTIAINGVEFILEANLDANGSVDVIVNGYGVDCGDAGGGNGGGNGGGSGGGNGTGDLIFYTNQDYGCGPINVNLSGNGSSTITGFFSNGAPDCSTTSSGGTFSNLAPGTYNFDASCSNESWSGTVTIQDGVCTQQQLIASGGGGGGGSGTGDVIFWINQDFGCGNVSVNVSGAGGTTISGFYGSTPSCSDTGAGGNLNNLPVGTYSFTASCTGINWNGNITISEDSCLRFQLN